MADKALVPRTIFGELISHISKPEITVITGPRQVGKTVLLKMLRTYLTEQVGVSSRNILYFNLDIIRDWEFFRDQGQLIEFLRARSTNDKLYVLVDEAQRVSDCGRFFKGIYDSCLNVKLVLTGSSSFEIKAGMKESLAGRKRLFHLSSFSFLEFLMARDESLASAMKDNRKLAALEQEQLLRLFREYIVWGGYPRVVLSSGEDEKLQILGEVYSSYIEKDIVGFLGVRNRTDFTRLVRLLAGQTGQLVNIQELSRSSGLDRSTVERHIYFLRETFIVEPVLPYHRNPRQEIIKQNKVYFWDTGIRNYSLEDFRLFEVRPDAGLVMENSICREILLSSGAFEKLRFWRTKQGSEVDFVVLRKGKILAVEVKSVLTKPTVPVPLRNFITKYEPEQALVVNLGISGRSIRINKTKVNFVYPYEINSYIKGL